MRNSIKEVLISEKEIQERVKELGQEITRDYKGKDLVVVGVLKGAVLFLGDLVKNISMPLTIDFIAVSSYGNSTTTSGVVRILKDLDNSIEGMDVLVVEDIIDSGLTLSYLYENLKSRGPNSVKICTLLDKPERRKVNVKVDYIGFVIEDEFVVGYGLDYAEKYRNLPEVCILKPEIYQK
ncbi:MAG: Hypoxanthine-guanine phosphoribosyltransferase [Firmicutes bacterium]|nr:Hypoxanthine-guanine phosphoribosyltransferase [Bacillota bacterium]MDI6707228.1 hypoxanthine phosphoribosyltransferase [Bacillota bacterium]